MAKEKSIFTKDVVLVMAASFFFMFSNMYCNPLINGYAQDLGASSAFAGIIVGMMSIVSMFLRPIAGNLTDRFSKYSLAFWGGILCFIGVAGYVLTPNSAFLLICRLINGLGFVLCTVCMTTWLSYLVPFNHVGEAMSFYGLMNALAMACAPAVSINLYKVIGYRAAMVISALSALLVVVTIQFVSNRAQPVAHSVKQSGLHIKIIQRDAIPVALLTALFAIPYFATQADIVEYAEQRIEGRRSQAHRDAEPVTGVKAEHHHYTHKGYGTEEQLFPTRSVAVYHRLEQGSEETCGCETYHPHRDVRFLDAAVEEHPVDGQHETAAQYFHGLP